MEGGAEAGAAARGGLEKLKSAVAGPVRRHDEYSPLHRDGKHERPQHEWAKTPAGQRLLKGTAIGGSTAVAGGACLGVGPGSSIPAYKRRKAADDKTWQDAAADLAALRPPPPPKHHDDPSRAEQPLELLEQQRQAWDL